MVIIIIIFLALIFGSKKLPDVARGIGKATSEFEKAKIQMRRAMEMAKTQSLDSVPDPNIGREKLEDVDEILGIDYSNKGYNELRTAIESEIRKTTK
jgi:sec-independent protein translocase protein TatA